MDIRSAIKLGSEAIRSDTRKLDAEVLLAFVLKENREYLCAHPETKMSDANHCAYKKIVQQRRKGEPVAYLIGKKEFFGLEITVNKNCLIPRPESELLVLETIKLAGNYKNTRVCDVGTGSGAIAIALARNLPDSLVTASDISEKALKIARANGRAHGLKIDFQRCDLLPENDFDIVVANLPYLKEDDSEISEETKKYEPHAALFGNGLSLYRKLFQQIKARITKPYYVLGEFGQGQDEEIKTMLPHAEIKNDLAGIPRIFIVNCAQ